MIHNKKIITAFAAALLTASTSFAMAQATGTENNATTGSEPGVGPASGADKKGVPGSMPAQGGSMKSGEMGSSSDMNNKSGQGSAGAPTPQSTEHSNPSTGAGR